MSRPFAAILASAALHTALACGSAAALDAVAGTQLVMHVGPGAEHRSLATIPAETQVTVHGCSEAEGWCLVRYEGRLGWVEGGSLDVVGFSRRPEDAVEPPVQQVIVVPVPGAPEAPHHGFVTAEDVIVGVGEPFGLAVVGGRPALGHKTRHRGRLAFKRYGFDRKARIRHHGTFKQPHRHWRFRSGGKSGFTGVRFGKADARSGKGLHVQRAHFGKRGHFVGPRKGFHVQRDPFGKRFHRDVRPGKRHSHWHIGKRGHAFRHAGKARFGGFRVKGGWRP